MLLLTATTDKIQVITDAAVTVDVSATFMDMSNADPPVVKGSTSGRLNTAIATATTTDVVAAPAASTTRNVKGMTIRNKHATTPVGVTVQYNQNTTLFEIHKAQLLAGDMLGFTEGIGWFLTTATRKAYYLRRVTSDSVHATAATFADVTGLNAPVTSGKHYAFLAHLYHVTNATTTGARFGFNAPTITAARLGEIAVIAGSATAATMGSQVGDVVLRDTAAIVETTGPATVALAILSGWVNPSADGTFSIRATSAVTVAAGLTVKQGSWLQLWECDN
jgi:hypothetical protein